MVLYLSNKLYRDASGILGEWYIMALPFLAVAVL
jgi:hypothetical protein